MNDFHAWEAWSPYEKKDPGMKRTLSGAATGKGAVYEWDGDSNVGAGRMEITESSPSSKVALNLDMIKPLTAHNVVEFTLQPEGDATTLTWSMKGDAPYFAKVIHVFFDMDSMVGTDFEAGLANLKALAEK
ncbi:MAG: SRPBCC family protein [Aeromicrobium sp.]